MKKSVDVIVIGAGVVGLAIGKCLLESRAVQSVVVLEKEEALGSHASGRNSGVLHAGFYYQPDSLKARFTREGNEKLGRFCIEHGLPYKKCGKVVVTRDISEHESLLNLYRRGLMNGIDLHLIDAKELSSIEPRATTATLALWSPRTGVADPKAVIEKLADSFLHLGGTLLKGEKVLRVQPGQVETGTGKWLTGHVVNCAGLYAEKMAHQMGFGLNYGLVPFKGLYIYGSMPPGFLSSHVYPVPDPRNPFLGVHLTTTVTGATKVGPTAIPALWKEDYGIFKGFNFKESIEISRLLGKFLFTSSHNALDLVRTEIPKYLRRHLLVDAQKLVPSIDPSLFKTRGRVGIRAQLIDRKSGDLEMDFKVVGDHRSTHVLNAVSPAWTSSLAFAEYVVDGIVKERFSSQD